MATLFLVTTDDDLIIGTKDTCQTCFCNKLKCKILQEWIISPEQLQKDMRNPDLRKIKIKCECKNKNYNI
jgi:hypothetical protein